MKSYVCLTFSFIIFQLFIGQIFGGHGGNGGYVGIGGSQIEGDVAQGGRGGGPYGKPGIVDCGEGCVINGRRQQGRLNGADGRDTTRNENAYSNGENQANGKVASDEKDGWFRMKRGNGGDGGKVYCPNCKIEGDTATGGDGGWFRRKRQTVVYNKPCSDYHCIIYITEPNAYAPCSARICDYHILGQN
uniref:Uncharacterized protein n=1 Tax=Acrobeloides nanus TaxID=290746 RepID=A0A914CWA0_9BILA